MAINDLKELDPSKRIRATLGEEFVSNVEADALKRIVSQANIETKKEAAPTGPVRNDFDVTEHMNRIVHSNPVTPTSGNTSPVTSFSREQALKNTCAMFENMSMKNRSPAAKFLMTATGFDKSRSRAENITNAGCLIGQVTSGVAVEHLADVIAKSNNGSKAKNIATAGIAGGIIDFAGAYLFSGNKDTVEGLFDPNNISQAEANIINKAILNEKLKYAAEHTAIGFIAPYAVSNILNKTLPEKVKSNGVVNALTSFGALAAVSKTVLNGVRVYKDAKDIKTLDGVTYSIVDGQPCEMYEAVAKYATRRSIDNHIDASIYGNLGGLTANTVKNYLVNKQIGSKLAEQALAAAAEPKVVVIDEKGTRAGTKKDAEEALKTAEKLLKPVA